MNNFCDADKKKIGITLILISIIVFGFIVDIAAIGMIVSGSEMSELRSIGGSSVAEAYYQLHGDIYISIGVITLFCSISIATIGTVYSSVLLRSCNYTWELVDDEIKRTAKNIKTRTIREASAFSAPPTSYMPNRAPMGRECPACCQPVASDSAFCTKCGFKMPTEKICASCGAKIPEGGSFCTRCGREV